MSKTLAEKYAKSTAAEVFPTPCAPVVENQTHAQLSLAKLNSAISDAGPEFEMEVKYVEERLQYLLASRGVAAEYALMRTNFKIAVDKGQ